MKKTILIADDEKNMIWALKKAFKKKNFNVITASDGQEAVDKFIDEIPDIVLLDLKMPKLDGIEVLKRIKEHNNETPVIMITAHGSAKTAVKAMKLGAYDYISKPFDIEELKILIEKAINYKSLNDEVTYLKEKLKENNRDIIYKGIKMEEVMEIIEKVAPTDATVLILGESGTGKELVADAIHKNSARKEGPFVKINCGALPENLLESELFGYEKGAFTGAVSNKLGKFDMAQGGTIFLDEVGEISPSIQVKLLRVLQEKEFERLGGNKTIKVDTRIITATNRNLKERIEKGEFREDLYYRLNVIPIEIPPLRERKEDIPLLVTHFLDKYSSQMGKGRVIIDKEALNKLCNYQWKGNVRELQNVIERCVILSSNNEIKGEDLPDDIKKKEWKRDYFSLPEDGISLEKVEKSLIKQALKKADYNQTKAAKLLDITRYTLLYRMDKYNIEK
ncbi:sigma-54-dependent transcriptional regulator [Dethiothermospora halolimnae]|uniref:sigma-54-dependent transcriptional regulator n=1 Tax=Dethiothermospora halolimnae TaxID=3114390 RepID=UPI003CCB846A